LVTTFGRALNWEQSGLTNINSGTMSLHKHNMSTIGHEEWSGIVNHRSDEHSDLSIFTF